MKTAFFFLMMMTAALPCFARIGETEAELKARYGKAEDLEGALVFQKEGLLVSATLHDGVCVKLQIIKEGSLSDKLSDGEAATLLEANKGKGTWNAVKSDNAKIQSWELNDRSRAAQFSGGYLVITDVAGLSKWEAAKAERDKAKLKGF